MIPLAAFPAIKTDDPDEVYASIKGRNPMTDGFGLIAFASLTPMIFVMGYGILL
jgi:hypothetical protein